MIMAVKKLLRRFGYDVVRYHPLFEIILKKYDIRTVIDVGANTGQFALSIHRQLPHAMIYSFEPLHDAFLKLSDNLKEVQKAKIFNVGLGEKNETASILRSSFSPSSSLLPMTELHKQLYPKSEKTTPEIITIKRLDGMMNDLFIEGNLLVKLDVQGYEDKVLRGGKELISKATMLLIETSFIQLYENQPLFDDIYSIVRDLGFTYKGSRERHYSNETGELIYEDSIFTKNQ